MVALLAAYGLLLGVCLELQVVGLDGAGAVGGQVVGQAAD
jgi:hypothetical protein